MATNLLTIGSTEQASTDVTLDDGEQATLIYKGAEGGVIFIQTKDDLGAYKDFQQLRSNGRPVVIDGKVIFRVKRFAGVACGVSQG